MNDAHPSDNAVEAPSTDSIDTSSPASTNNNTDEPNPITQFFTHFWHILVESAQSLTAACLEGGYVTTVESGVLYTQTGAIPRHRMDTDMAQSDISIAQAPHPSNGLRHNISMYPNTDPNYDGLPIYRSPSPFPDRPGQVPWYYQPPHDESHDTNTPSRVESVDTMPLDNITTDMQQPPVVFRRPTTPLNIAVAQRLRATQSDSSPKAPSGPAA